MVFSLLLSLLAEQVIVAALAEGAVVRVVCIIVRDEVAAPVALDEFVFPALGADIVIAALAVAGFAFRQFFAARFTDNGFHIIAC